MAWSLMFVRTQWPSFFIHNVLIQLESMASQGCQCHLLCCNIAHFYALCLFFFLSFFYFFKLGYSCFTIMFVSAIQWSESAIYTYIHPLPYKSPSHSPSHPSMSSQSTEFCSLHYTACFHQQSFYTWQCTHVSPNFPIPPTPYPPLGP